MTQTGSKKQQPETGVGRVHVCVYKQSLETSLESLFVENILLQKRFLVCVDMVLHIVDT